MKLVIRGFLSPLLLTGGLGSGVAPFVGDFITRGFGSQLFISCGFGLQVIPPPPTGIDSLSSLQVWWQATPTVQVLTSDGLLWFLEAPEVTALPYATYFLVSEPTEDWTTGYAIQRASIQVNFHDQTAGRARSASKSFRQLVKKAPLTINGDPVMHVLPDGQGMRVGEGLGPNGADCWMAYATLDIPWTRTMSATVGGPFNGSDVLSGIVAWLQGALTTDEIPGSWPVFYAEAPESQDPGSPYVTFELTDEPVEIQTTGFAFYRAKVRFRIHAATASDAREAAVNFRTDMEQQAVSIDGQPVLHVLGDGDEIELGEGLGPGGSDVWIASETFDIPWTE